MNPAFHRSLPIKTMASVVNTLFSVIDNSDGPVLITSAMQNFTLDVLGLAIFGKHPLRFTKKKKKIDLNKE